VAATRTVIVAETKFPPKLLVDLILIAWANLWIVIPIAALIVAILEKRSKGSRKCAAFTIED